MSAAAWSLAKSSASTRAIAEAAKGASRVLAPLDEGARNGALEAMAKGLEAASDELLAVNSKEEGDG
jgi:gamma-glutamyl phosphate reductase